jgi:hypothetical protein
MRSIIIIGLLSLPAVVSIPSANAATITWSGAAGNSNWFTPTNWFGSNVPSATDDVVITNGPGLIVLTNSVTVQSLDITNRTLRFQGWPTILTASNILLRNGAVFSHFTNTATASPWNPDNGIYLVCTTLTVFVGGAINGDGVGYYGTASATGYGPGGGGGSVATAGGSGAGYGGWGGIGNTGSGGVTYGVSTNPAWPGSAGGGGNSNKGTPGGGYVSITASGTVTVNGVISMNGIDAEFLGWHFGGGGSGGGILIQCATLTGNGTIRANGGGGGYWGSDWQGGAGSGGRIAIYENTPGSFGGQLSASNGVGYSSVNIASRPIPGTVYFSDWGIMPAFLTNGGAARFTAGTGLAASVTISNYTMYLEWGWETNRLKAGTITVQNGGRITHTRNTATSTNASGQWVPDGGIFIECSNLTVQSGGMIIANGLGYDGVVNATGYGPGGGGGSSATAGGCGGGYGGLGGLGYTFCAAGATYGLATNPASPGSGGGGGNSNKGVGGGGYAKIVATGTVAVDGVISMNGADAETLTYHFGGGGSGGGILIQCASLIGNGTISADGGAGGVFGIYQGGGGSGGRIAIYESTPVSFSGQISANGGLGAFTFPDARHYYSIPGTVYLSDWSILPALLTNGGAARFTAGTGMAAGVTISNYTLYQEWGWETNRLKAGTITVQNGAKITHTWNTAASTNASGQWVPDGGIFIECSNLTVQSGGTIIADGLGYDGSSTTNGYGPGGGGGTATTAAGSGAGHGGMGGLGKAGYAGPTYGMSNNPLSPGSGGGGGNSNKGTPGGGYVQIVASGNVTVNGVISVNGIDAESMSWHFGGGGSGGGLLIRCGGLLGTGTIRANGGGGGYWYYGPGNDWQGGGGAGGRIAIYARNAPFYTGDHRVLFSATTTGGIGCNYGARGTVYLDFKPRGTVWSTW